MNSAAEGRGAVETALEGFCDSLPSSRLEESSHVKVYFLLCLCSGVRCLWCSRFTYSASFNARSHKL